MKKLSTLSLKRTVLSALVLNVFIGVLLAAVVPFITTGRASAQQATNSTVFSWVNAGILVSNGNTYFNVSVTENTDFINTALGDCTYQGKTVHRDVINIPAPDSRFPMDNRDPGVGNRTLVDPNAKDPQGNETCATKPATPMTGANTFKSVILFYQDGDTVYSYNAAQAYSKTKSFANSDGTGDIYVQTDEFGDSCPTVLVHGTLKTGPGLPGGGAGDYGSDWFIFPMSTRAEHNGTAVSEKFGRLGFPNADANCVVDEGILDRAHFGEARGNGGVGGNLRNYSNFTIMFGDDAYKINAGVGTMAENGPPAGTSSPVAGGGSGNSGPIPKTPCDQSFGFIGFLSLKWFVCPVIDIMMNTVGQLEDFLVQQLNIDMAPLESNTAYHKIWASLRTIALAIIVIVALVMVIFQAAGAEAFSAYTMKTLFARFGVAVLLIVISWSLLHEVTQAVNWITDGARTLIYAPFNAASQGGQGLTTGSAYILAALAGGAVIALGPWGLLSFVLTAVLSIGLTLLVLVLVHSLVYILIMFSPIFIALSVLPNTRKGYDFGKNALSSLYIGLIAVAFAMPAIDVIAESTYNAASGSSTTKIVQQIAALLLKFGRVFIVLFIFSRVGGALGTITGMVNDRGRGAFDRLKNFRGNTMKKRAADMASGELYKGRTPFGRAFNATTRGVTSFAHSDSKGAMLGLTGNRNRRTAWSAAHEQNDSINAMRYGKTEKAQVAQHNDPLLQAQTYRTAQEARRNMANDWGISQEEAERAISSANVNGGFGYVKQQNAARQLARTGTGYKNLDQLHNTVSRVAGNNTDMANSLLGGINSDTKGAGRFDLAAGHGYHMQLYNARQNLNTNDPASVANYNRMIQQGYVEAVKGTAAHDMLRSKPVAMENTMPAMSRAIYEARGTMNNPAAGFDANGNSRQQMATEEYGRLNQVMENYKGSTAYAAPAAVQQFEEHGYSMTEQDRRESRAQADERAVNSQVYNPATGAMETVHETDAAGNVLLDRQGRPIPLANPGHRPGVAQGRNEQQGRQYDPYDPRNP